MIQHQGEWVGDEGNRSLLTIVDSLDETQCGRLRLVVRDTLKVDSVDLYDSDGARQFLFEQKMRDLLVRKNCLQMLGQVAFAQVLPENPAANEVMLERIKRVNGSGLATFQNLVGWSQVSSLNELQVAFPDYDLTPSAEWLTIESESSLLS